MGFYSDGLVVGFAIGSFVMTGRGVGRYSSAGGR